jgi:hypothetical protein
VSAIAVSERGQEMLDDLMPELADATDTQQVVDMIGRELARLEAAITEASEKLLPSRADDTYNSLKMWELLLGLPVAAPTTVEARRNLVLASIRNRKAASGADWVGLIDAMLGGAAWTHTEDVPPYTVVIVSPHTAGSYEAQALAQFARRVTPAHLRVTVTDGDGFIVQVSIVGQDIL